MELITELMNDPKNTNRNYTHKIKESKYVQSSSQMDDSYSTINELFLSLYDPSFSLLPSKEKTFYMKQKLLQIATDIDEKSREKSGFFDLGVTIIHGYSWCLGLVTMCTSSWVCAR